MQWMGASREGSSSGLHHDYHDNFYLLIRGKKLFRLYSPDCAPCMYTYGKMERVYANGLISYVGNETRSDGVPLRAFECSGEVDDNDDGRDGGSDNDEEQGVFFGKGYDYTSDSESTRGFDENKDDFDEILAREEQSNHDPLESAADKLTQRPNSFSKIDVETLQNPASVAEYFPQFAACRECIVELKAGQTLYLPAGWFHEVTSATDTKGSNHTALNYWYYPPDSVNSFEQPYKRHELLLERTGQGIDRC